MEPMDVSVGTELLKAMTPSNLLLVVVAGITLLVWLAQEIGRSRQQRQWLRAISGSGTVDVALDEPGWSAWAYRIVVLLWVGWLALALMRKDGDFAFVLVLLTLLAGLIAAVDCWGFERSRKAFAAQPPVQGYLDRARPEQTELLQTGLLGQRPIAEYGRSFFPVLAVVVVLRSFIIEPFQIPSSSMVPTLLVGDYILVNKFAYGLRLPVIKSELLDLGEPQRGDVVVFFPPNDTRYFIKRLIGLPGDHIDYRDKVLYINGERADQELLALLPPARPAVELASEQLGSAAHLIRKELNIDRGDYSTVVRPHHYFMMGDNRDNSSDSRVWGQVPERNIVGKAFAIWMHWESIASLPGFERVGAIQ